MAGNGLDIAAMGEALTFNTAQMYKKGLNVEYSTSAPHCGNTSLWASGFLSSAVELNLR